MSEEKTQGGVQSLEVGLTVLDALISHQAPMMLKELAEKLSMHPAKVHRYVVSLVRMNYAKQLDDGRYALGDQAWRLGLSCIQRTDAIQAAQPMINALHRQIDIARTAYCAVDGTQSTGFRYYTGGFNYAYAEFSNWTRIRSLYGGRHCASAAGKRVATETDAGSKCLSCELG